MRDQTFEVMSNPNGYSIEYIEEVLADFKLANLSRETCMLGRKEVLTGKAKFGIFGDGKEIAQIAMAKQFRDGDWRSGYYRDQTFMMAIGGSSPENFFHQLYGQNDKQLNPGNAGRSFNNHFASANMNPDGTWCNLMKQKNTSSDISPTAGQMPRLVGLAYASKLFRQNEELHQYTNFSNKGNEVAFGMIGDSSTSEGHFFEAINAAGVLQIPMAIAIWDDGYGISVPKKYQTTKESISEVLKGFERDSKNEGIVIMRAKGWDYPGLCKMFEEGIKISREEHVPVLFHVSEINQPFGHSTSGSHERYKSEERLQWEKDFDGIKMMREWILEEGIAAEEELLAIEQAVKDEVREARNVAWKAYQVPIKNEQKELIDFVEGKVCECPVHRNDKISKIKDDLKRVLNPNRKDNLSAAKRILSYVCVQCDHRKDLKQNVSAYIRKYQLQGHAFYSDRVYNETKFGAINVQPVFPVFTKDSEMVAGREILRDNFDYLFNKYPLLVTFGEDTGKIGGVNQSLEGLQEKYGELRITDTGIRELTIIGQGIGLALRGLRPIAEIQYFDYLLYALQTISDDVATTHWRTAGDQKLPLIIRTRGHRLEGIWHSGSPLSMVINSIRGVYVCVPRNMTQAAGFYNTLLEGEDAALVIEPLNGYRLREKRPENIGEYKIPLGMPEILKEGTDVTLVTYGACVRIAEEAVEQLNDFGISVELIDVQTLLPFDTEHIIAKSIQKTNKVVFFDEDVPGGATAFMMHKVLEKQQAFFHLDAPPKTLSAHEHRPAYSSDGDYFSNPNAEDVFETVYAVMHEYNPEKYPELYKSLIFESDYVS